MKAHSDIFFVSEHYKLIQFYQNIKILRLWERHFMWQFFEFYWAVDYLKMAYFLTSKNTVSLDHTI